MKKNYHPKIVALCITVLLTITCLSNSYAQTDNSYSFLIKAKNEAKSSNGINHTLIIVISCAVWMIGYNFLSYKILIKKSTDEKKSLKEENKQLQLLNEMQQIKQENERKIAQMKLKQLHREIKHKKALLLQNITEHIHLAKRIQQHKNTEKVPQWLESYLTKYSYSSAKNWNSFLIEFEGVFPQFVSYMQETYPTLTQNDVQYLLLAILGLDINDIAFVLNKTTRTIWNRRDTIKSRLEIDDSSIEEWLDALMNSYQRKYRELLEEKDQD